MSQYEFIGSVKAGQSLLAPWVRVTVLAIEWDSVLFKVESNPDFAVIVPANDEGFAAKDRIDVGE